MTTHRARRTARAATLAAVTAALALGVTACDGADDGSKAASADRAADTAQNGPASSGGDSAESDSGDGTGKGERPATSSGGTDTSEGQGTTSGTQQCRGDEMLVTAVHRFAGQEGDHLLLTASNEGGKPCWITSYPAVKLGGDVDSAALPHAKKDDPSGGERVTLQPGDKAYSAVNLFDYGSKSHTADAFAIALRGADGEVGPFYSVDSKGEKPQFSWNEADVLNWNTEKPYNF
ncbi:DUF4232 domain-containing protein [Streptomyces reniochalinae]|uniref:DUF4232 domain-containing protein n=1 Tax=Streptomyces reniochalinae TaxID=2250578 RepID=A0A367F7W8_9ACTN|nr:DUF4232 domain-containing protein [Streptomyces reniochalinae]RCG25757.1 DUF4232 domain-containing protein [Streptomyces reniochalinae]